MTTKSKFPTYLKPLVFQVESATIRVGEVFPQLNYIRVQGWISAPNKPDGFKACRLLSEQLELGRQGLGGYCDAKTDTEAVSFPFSFDMPLEHVRPTCARREYPEEGASRVMKELRSAAKYFRIVPALGVR